MQHLSGRVLPSLSPPYDSASRPLSGLTVAIALTLPSIEGLVAPSSHAAESGSTSVIHDVEIEYDDKRRPVRETCPSEGWVDTIDPLTGTKCFRDLTTAQGTQRFVYDEEGVICLPFQAALLNDKDLTEKSYVKDIARRFKTPESLARYFEGYFSYTYDTPDPRDPFRVGTKATYDDYWQTPIETLQRHENGKYLGDCDDLAFLAQAILQEQGKRPLVLNVGTHAICAWIDSTSQGFTGHSICTFGYDRNGMIASGTAAEEYLPTPREALQTVMRKYEKAGVGSELGFSYTVGDTIDVMLPSHAQRLQYTVPLAALTQGSLYDDLRPYDHNRDDQTLSFYRNAAIRHPAIVIFRLEYIKALKRDGSLSLREEMRRELHALCTLSPDVPTYQEELSVFYGEQQEYTTAIHHCLKALTLDKANTGVMMPYLTSLSNFIGDYVQEFGPGTLRDSLPALRATIHSNGYAKDDLAMMRTCLHYLDDHEGILPLLAARAEATFRASHSVASAFSPRSTSKGEYASHLIDLMREQLTFGMNSDARATFERIRSIRGPSASMRDALPSLRHLPYREDTVALYRSLLEHCPDWSGGHMELVEYLHKAGQKEAAMIELHKAVACCNDIPTILKDLAELPGLAETPEWPSIVESLQVRKQALVRARR